ncbi:outer membrane protein assembly factor BamD [Azomonas macrocytogenes]|uniref:Outer membrane protein assembly factor BamD n=1 Tax=Azomonas macrocytogenes TaxID=69962 RepID=A0A839T1E5_AZOMA|nr:outer membrane protein assembly factor BamD [Azomonas macrocytogenes]MBB3102410.1 outer membrane protein assembly factor BamD [Azomonas macrocytogenes]
MHVKHLLPIVILALAACSSDKSKDENSVDESLGETALYQQSQEDLDNSSYANAIAKLKALEARYPFGRYAEQAQLELTYAYYKNTEPDAARAAADRFIRLHPEHPNVDYAYYIKGLASFDQDQGMLARFFPLDMTKRDPGAARDSFTDFSQLTSRYPNSRYSPDAKARMIYLRNLLAANEIHVAHYYLRRKAYVAAVNRGRYVVENYQGTPSVGDGLAIMTEAYLRLGLQDLSDTSLATLKLNYPQHPTLENGNFVPSVKETTERSWLSRTALRLIEEEAPPPPRSSANRDLTQQFEQARQDIPRNLLPPEQPEDKNGADSEDGTSERSWWSRLTFGLFD